MKPMRLFLYNKTEFGAQSLSVSHMRINFSMNTDFARTQFLPEFVMATCVDEKTFMKN